MSCAGAETAAPDRAEPPPTSSPEPSSSDDQSDTFAPLAAPTPQPTPTAQPAPTIPEPEPTTRATAEPAVVAPGPTPTAPAPTAPAHSGPSAQTVVLQEANPRVTGVVYPRPDYDGNPWSQWGQGVVLPDGRVISAIGDHLGRGGNSFIFVFDPATGVMTRVADVADSLSHPAESWGFGKVHGQMVLGEDGDVYFSTYWGSRRGLEFDDAYQGDMLLRMNTDSHALEPYALEPIGVPVPFHGVPSLAGGGRYLYGEALDPFSNPNSGGLFVFDTVADDVIAWLPDERHAQFRNVIVREDSAMVAASDGSLLRYEPGATALLPAGISLGDRLRASTRPDSSGVVYAVTTRQHDLVAIDPDGNVRSLGNAVAYSTSIALLPDESAFIYVPDAHGGTANFGAPVIAVDTSTGVQTTLVELDQLARDGLGLVLGGSFNVTVDPTRRLAHIGFNAGPTQESPWGEVVQITVELDNQLADRPAANAAASSLEAATDTFGLTAPLTGIRGHAVAVADINADGWDDLFVGTFADRPPETYAVRGAQGPNPDRLLLGGPDGFRLDDTFPGRLARSAGAAFADLDGDGDPDLIVSRNVRRDFYGTEILRNDDGRFVSVLELDGERGGRAVGTLDCDGDGRLDIFLVEDKWVGGSSVLFHNDGDLQFTDTTAAAGLPNDVFGLGLAIADLDGNGADDLVVGGANRIFLGDGSGGFIESTGADLDWDTYGPEDDIAHVAVGDLNADGRPDIVFGQHYNSTLDFDTEVPVRLYLNQGIDNSGNLLLSDATDAAGLVGLPTKAPKVLLVDLNNDGWLDLVTTASAGNGAEPAVFYHQGVTAGMPNFAAPAGLGDDQYWIDAAVIDADRDGRDDVFLVEWEPALPSRLFRTTPG